MHLKLFFLLNSFFETFTVVLTLQLKLHNLLFSLMTTPGGVKAIRVQKLRVIPEHHKWGTKIFNL